jgi:hypothetical protein
VLFASKVKSQEQCLLLLVGLELGSTKPKQPQDSLSHSAGASRCGLLVKSKSTVSPGETELLDDYTKASQPKEKLKA